MENITSVYYLKVRMSKNFIILTVKILWNLLGEMEARRWSTTPKKVTRKLLCKLCCAR
jgi:hypothetical protein